MLSLLRQYSVPVAWGLWAALLATALGEPWLAGAANPGDAVTRNTVRVALLYYAIAAALMLRIGAAEWAGGSWRGRLARVGWTLAWAAYVVHLAMAFHFVDQWSHARAVARTQARTSFGEGIYVSHLFTLLWTADVAWWWLRPAAHAARPAWAARSLYLFMAFVVFNATVVFEQGWIRWAGVALFAGLALVWWCERPGRLISIPPGAGGRV